MSNNDNATETLILLLIVLLIGIWVGLLTRKPHPTPPDKRARAKGKPGHNRVIDIFEETGKAAGQ